MNHKNLTIKEAYKAMYFFLENLYKRTKSEDLAEFLGSMSLLKDKLPADPAMWNDWLQAIKKAQKKSSSIDLNLINRKDLH